MIVPCCFVVFALSFHTQVYNGAALRKFCEENRNADGPMHEAYPVRASPLLACWQGGRLGQQLAGLVPLPSLASYLLACVRTCLRVWLLAR